MATTKPSQNITLNISREHPALTPEMRQMAAELWEMVKARVDEEGFPLRGATLWASTDMEGVSSVFLDVLCNTPRDEANALARRMNPDYARWIDQLPEERRDTLAYPLVYFGGLAPSRVNGGV